MGIGLVELLILGLLGLGLLVWLAMVGIAASKNAWGWLGLLILLPCLAGGALAGGALMFRQSVSKARTAAAKASAAARLQAQSTKRAEVDAERARSTAERARTSEPSQPEAEDPVSKDPMAWLRTQVSRAGLTLVSLEKSKATPESALELTVHGPESKFRRWVDDLEGQPKLSVREMIMVASEPAKTPDDAVGPDKEIDQEIRGTVTVEVLSD